MRYGAVDIGTNSCRLLIAQADAEKGLRHLHKELDTTRIGEGVNRSGLINTEAMERNLLTLRRFQEKMQEYGVEKYRAIATSAVREAHNGDEFVRRAWEESMVKVDIVKGEEEAGLSYLGVKQGLKLERSPLVVDLGGGSTEFICPEEKLLLSLPLGAVRATEADMYAAQIGELLAPLGKIKERIINRPLVLVGGTATTLVAVKLGLEEYNADLVHGTVLSRTEIGDLYNLLERMPLSLRRRLPGLQPERADIINKGALIILVIIEVLGKKEIVVSESDLLQGIIWSLMG
ncbi:MAG: Ppx/GppA phosphatase family protein [Syntrophomonas sp.]|nr:Ppx/GppA phosphatase family protein [Syntrophomonas sp.]